MMTDKQLEALYDPKENATDHFEKKGIVRLVLWGKNNKGECTRCRVNLLDVPVGFYCGTCGWVAK